MTNIGPLRRMCGAAKGHHSQQNWLRCRCPKPGAQRQQTAGLLDPGHQQYSGRPQPNARSEEHTSELQSRGHLVCRLLLEKKKEMCRSLHEVSICGESSERL